MLRVKAAETGRLISDLVNDAVKLSLAEDAADLAAFDERARERSVSFEKVVWEKRPRGRL
ncbi:MAG TPA: CopG family transcriptional regulator [Myxococcota bacterium]|nr:CopG family transcriptional regulator [Myxococcota bacterium]